MLPGMIRISTCSSIIPAAKLGLYELMDVKERAQAFLGRRTDIMTRASLHPLVLEKVEESALRAF